MIEALNRLEAEALARLDGVSGAEGLEAWRLDYLSRQGQLAKAMEGMKTLTPAERPEAGKVANRVKQALHAAFEAKKEGFACAGGGMPEDPTLPGRPMPRGNLHVIQQTLDEMIALFRRMGFALADGPDVETEFHNFDALNTPPDHPARNEQDTFYVDAAGDDRHGRRLLRSHTSTVQIRTMMSQKPPVRIIAPGRCYRRDEVDATHGMFFHQVEGLVVDRGIHLGHLKGILEHFFREWIGSDIEVRFRPHFFPFTEPSYEVDMRRPGMEIRGKAWTEIAGCGMVDPNVFRGVGIDPEQYTGLAFGIGVERMVMMRHGIPDLRLFYENDVRFLAQFPAV